MTPLRTQRILLAISTMEQGGAQRVIARLVDHWVEQGRGVVLVTLESVDRDFFTVDPRVERIGLGLVGESRTLRDKVARFRETRRALRQTIASTRPDVVVSFQDRLNVTVLVAARRLRVPVVVSERIDPRHWPIGRSWDVLRRVVYRRAATIVVQTDAVGRWAAERFRSVPVAVIPNPVAPSSAGVETDVVGSRTIVAAGRLVDQKGFDLLLDAFAVVAARHPDWSLVVWGDGPDRGALVDRAERLGIGDRVRFPGATAAIASELGRAGAFVLSSRFEGFPNVLLEAMAEGLAVVAFDCPSGPGDIIRSGHDGLLVPNGDVAALASAIDRVLGDADLRVRLGADAREVTERFAPERVLAAWDAVVDGRRALRVCFVIRALGYGGAERQLVLLATGLQRMGHHVEVVVFYGGPLCDDLRDAGVVVHDLGKRTRWDALRFVRDLVASVRAGRPDVVHGYLDLPNLLSVPLKWVSGARAAVWGVRASALDMTVEDWLPRTLYGLEPRVARLADAVIVNSASGVRDAVRRGFPARLVHHVPNGIDTEVFRPGAPGERDAARAALGLPTDVPVVVRIGRYHPMKDHPALLRAAAEVASEVPDAVFVCAGDGSPDERRALERIADGLCVAEAVRFLPGRTDVRSLYLAADVVVSSSSYGEGFPNVLAEAMACGVPCVTTDVGDARDIVGDLGVVVPPAEPAALARGIVEVLRRVGTEPGLRDAVRCSIVARYGVARLVARTEDVLCRA